MSPKGWIHRQYRRPVKAIVGGKDCVGESYINAMLLPLVRSYIIGVYLSSPGFQNDVMDTIIGLCSSIYYDLTDPMFPLGGLHYIWNHTQEICGLQRFILYSVRCCLSKQTFLEAEKKGLIPHNLTVELATEG